MKLLFLGTGAADWPLKKKEGMTEFRRLSSLLIDDVLLIDPGPQVLEALLEYGKDASNIKYIINTHKHSDHINIGTLEKLEELELERLLYNGAQKNGSVIYTAVSTAAKL